MPAPYIWARLIAQVVGEPPVSGLEALWLRYPQICRQIRPNRPGGFLDSLDERRFGVTSWRAWQRQGQIPRALLLPGDLRPLEATERRIREKRQSGRFSSYHLLSAAPENVNDHYPDRRNRRASVLVGQYDQVGCD